MSSSSTPGVALVGAGYWGKNLARNFRELGALRVVCEADGARGAEVAGPLGVEATSDWRATLARTDISAVAIATPAETHAQLAREAMEAGKDVFVEKPMALSVADAEALGRVAKERGRVLMVGHLLRYHPAVLALKDLIDRGELGQINYISSNRLNFGRIRREENILWSFAPHDISVILYLLGEEPLEVAAHGSGYLDSQIADVTLSHLQFKSRAQAYLFVSWLHPFKEQKLTVVGERGMVVFDDGSADKKLVRYAHQVEWKNRQPVANKAEGEVIALSKDEPLRLECGHFLECVAMRKTPRTDAAEGTRVLRVLNALSDSLVGGGKPISISTAPVAVAPAKIAGVHETAVVDAGCEIGAGTKIWHFSHVLSGSKVGGKCNIGQNVVIGPKVTIGNGVKIQNNVSVYEGVTLEDDVFCGPSMVFTNVMNPRAHVVRKHEYKPTLVRKGASIGANATIVCGTTLGRYCFVGAGSVVTKDVADYALVVGVPARRVGWMCACGVRLDFSGGEKGRAKCADCGAQYQLSSDERSVSPWQQQSL